MSTPHYFIAVPLPLPLKQEFKQWQQQLKRHLPYKQWPHEEDLHITLKFLGAVEEKALKKLIIGLKVVESISTFNTNVGSIGTFGKPDRPRVLWAGVHKIEALENLQKKVENIAEDVGFPREKRVYLPHITLAKKWNGTPLENLKAFTQPFTNKTFSLPINKVVVYQIFPSKSPKYKVVEAYDLGKGEKHGAINKDE